MADGAQNGQSGSTADRPDFRVTDGLARAVDVARTLPVDRTVNGVAYASLGDTGLALGDLERVVGAVPETLSAALAGKAYFFVPLALPEPRAEGHRGSARGVADDTSVALHYTADRADEAICHRNVAMPGADAGAEATGFDEAVFISARLLNDRFALAFEFFINVGHAVVDSTGVPLEFVDLAWAQAVAETRGETSQDAWESRQAALPPAGPERGRIDEKARGEFLEDAFADAIAIYLLSLAVDFDYSELREREYPLLAPAALADRLRLAARLFPPPAGYEFSIRYRRRA